MAKLYIRSRKQKTPYRSLGFYTVLALSLMAVGAAAWSASVGIQHIDRTAEQPPVVSNLPDQNQPEAVDRIVSDLPAEIAPPEEIDGGDDTAEVDDWDIEPEETDPTVAHYFVLPVSGEIIKKFDPEALQYSETYGDMRLHNGIDIKADLDTRIKSAGNGVVEKVYADERTGNTVVINHGNGIVAYYCGLNNIPMVSEGETVLAGTDLGALSTLPDECADAPHLHFAVQQDGTWTSPLALMNMEGF